ncbi:MAG TPA: hypothetical protein VFW68_07520 [Rhodocyclaceae bacterium]|nr:hypothetical protein [Rhodocyclaceae bacterium]
MQDLMRIFNEAGWLANALGILVPIGSFLLLFFKVVKPFLSRSEIISLLPSTFEVTWDIASAKEIAKIAIVDDQLQDFPVAELKGNGFNISTYKQVQLSAIAQLATYDIVFLDMKGIVKDDPEYGGLKLIAELRKTSPNQKICAVSSKTFDPTATEFFRQADKYKKKPLTAQECKAVIESFLDDMFNAKRVVEAANFATKAIPVKKRIALISKIKSHLAKNDDSQTVSKSLAAEGLDVRQSFQIISLYRMLAHATKRNP